MKRLAFVVALLCGAPSAFALNCSSNPFTLTNGQTADATQVMSNFNNLQNCANNNLAHNGANSDITSLAGLTTPLSATEGGTGLASPTANNLLTGAGAGAFNVIAPLTDGNVLTVQGGVFKSLVHTAGTVTLVADATNGGLTVTSGATSATLKMTPADLVLKATPVGSDLVVLGDSAASFAPVKSSVASLQTAVSPASTQLVRAWGAVNSSQACSGCSAGVSIAKNGAGDYTVTTGVNLASTNYSVQVTIDTESGSPGSIPGTLGFGVYQRTATTFKMAIFSSSVGTDIGFNFAVFGNN